MREHRFVTLTGAGGIGKTQMALRVGATLVDSAAAHVWLVELAPVAVVPPSLPLRSRLR